MKREKLQLTPQIQRSIRDHYEQLYANKMDNLEEMEKLLEQYSLQRLNQEEIENMSRPIKITEIVIKRLPTTCDLMASQANSTKYLEELTTILLKLFQNMAEEGKLPNSFYEVTITLIPK